jgi:antitoxin ParD1/3/4
MSIVELSLPPDLEAFVNAKIAEGQYQSRAEMVQEALIFLRERDRQRELRLQDLRKEIQVGLDQLQRGERTPLDIESIKKEVIDQLNQSKA